jgi:hypothetical protein
MFLSVQKYNELKEREVKITDNVAQSARNSIFFLSTGCLKRRRKGSHSGFAENSSLLGHNPVALVY